MKHPVDVVRNLDILWFPEGKGRKNEKMFVQPDSQCLKNSLVPTILPCKPVKSEMCSFIP